MSQNTDQRLNPELQEQLRGLCHPTPDEAARKLPQHVVPVYEEIRILLDEESGRQYQTRHKIGNRVITWVDKQRQEGKGYGDEILPTLSRALGLDAQELYWTRKFALTTTAAEVEMLASLRMMNGRPITWSHVKPLLDLTKDERESWLAQIIEKSWTVKDLSKHLDSGVSRPEETRGRKLKVPQTLPEAVEQQLEFTGGYLKRCETVWLKKGQTLTDLAKASSPDELATQRDHLNMLKSLLSTLSLRAVEQVVAIDDLLARLPQEPSGVSKTTEPAEAIVSATETESSAEATEEDGLSRHEPSRQGDDEEEPKDVILIGTDGDGSKTRTKSGAKRKLEMASV